MRVAAILDRKGAEVATVAADATLAHAAEAMARHDVGALVIPDEGGSLVGVISERDIARCVGRLGASCLERPVAEFASQQVTTCELDTTVDQLMATMTDQRVRHVPVLADGALAGIVSIGDVVKSRLDELELQAETLEQYVTGSH